MRCAASVVVIDPPAAKPLTLDEVKAQCRVDHDDDDAYLTGLIDVAVAHIDGPESVMGRSLINRTLELRLRDFGGGCDIDLPSPPVVEITSVKYDDADGVEQTVDPSVYRVLAASSAAPRLSLAYNQSWPSPRSQPEAVRIRYVAGYGEQGSDVPAPLRHAMLLQIGSWYEQRETVIVGQTVAFLPAYEALIAPYRIY